MSHVGDDIPPASETSTRAEQAGRNPPRRRSFLPRLGLRSLFVLAIVFCLAFASIGRGLYRVRQEDAAIETILRGGGSLYSGQGRGLYGASGRLSDPGDLPVFERAVDLALRSIGWRKRGSFAQARVEVFDAGDPAADEAMAALAVFPELRSVTLFGPGFDDSSLKALDRLPRLEELYLIRTEATAEGLANLGTPERIRYLHVQEHGLRANVLSGAGSLRGLTEIDVINCLVTKDDIAAFASLPELKTLGLSDVQLIGDDVLTPLAKAKKLRTLDFYLARRPPRREELQAIAAAPALERLQVAVLDDGLSLFVGAKQLRFLGPYLPISEEAGRAFSLESPECVIRIRRRDDSPLYLRNGERVERPAFEPPY